MRRLTALDASFLSLESAQAPMAIAGLSVLDPRTSRGRLTFEGFTRHLESRLGASRVFREKLAGLPFDLGRPYWVDDESFDLDHHLEHTTLAAPGGLRELHSLMAYELSRLLDRRRPLWHLLWVEGVQGVIDDPEGAVALVSRVHHAAIDGISGAEVLAALFDLHPEGRDRAFEAESAGPDPGALARLGKSSADWIRTPLQIPKAIGAAVKGGAASGLTWGLHRLKPPPLPFSAPSTLFNRAVGQPRHFAPAYLELDRIKQLKSARSATVNDVVLTVCAGALRRYLMRREGLPDKPLVAMVPISIRASDENGQMGNRVSAMLVELPTHLEKATDRFDAVVRETRRSKMHHEAIGAETLVDVGQVLPFALGGLAARLYSHWHLADKTRPFFNLVVTNVPGPRQRLYVAGATLLRHAGSAPLFDGLGLILPIFSYAGRISIGVTACARLMPDADLLAIDLEESLEEL